MVLSLILFCMLVWVLASAPFWAKDEDFMGFKIFFWILWGCCLNAVLFITASMAQESLALAGVFAGVVLLLVGAISGLKWYRRKQEEKLAEEEENEFWRSYLQ